MREGTAGGRSGLIRAGPVDGCVAVLDTVLGAHARDVAATAVDEDVGRGAYQGVEGGVDFDWRAGEDGVADELDDEDGDLDEGEGVGYPRCFAAEEGVACAVVVRSLGERWVCLLVSVVVWVEVVWVALGVLRFEGNGRVVGEWIF